MGVKSLEKPTLNLLKCIYITYTFKNQLEETRKSLLKQRHIPISIPLLDQNLLKMEP